MSSEPEINAVTNILKGCDNPCIVDLGSYDGSDAWWMAQAVAGKPRKMIMVEADKENYARVEQVAKTIGATSIFGAISDHTGESEFWACYTGEGRGSGSIQKPTGHLIEKPWYDFRLLDSKIPCYSLDDIFAKEGLGHIDLLWVDIQGAEANMIRGGQNALRLTRYLFIEAEKRILYDGQVIQADLLKMLPGWTVIGDFDFNLLLRNDG